MNQTEKDMGWIEVTGCRHREMVKDRQIQCWMNVNRG